MDYVSPQELVNEARDLAARKAALSAGQMLLRGALAGGILKDIGLVGQEGSWQVVVGGAAGKSVRKADLLATVETTEATLEAAELFFQYYREHGNYLERTYDFVVRLGIDKIRKETVYATEATRRALLDRLHKSKTRARDAWLEGQTPVNPTQFIPLTPIEQVMA